MPKVLNQNELDALLDMVQTEGSEGVEAMQSSTSTETTQPTYQDPSRGFNVATAENVYIFDFKRPERVSTEQSNALEVLHDTFARNLSASFSGFLRTVIDVRLISVEQFTYSEFTMSVPSPTIINSLSCKPLQGNIVLEMNPSILFPFIDRLLGGSSSGSAYIDRPFTRIEQSLITGIISRLLDMLEETWSTITPIDFRVAESETNPMLMQIVAPNEPVILLSFEVIMGENSGLVNICLPFKVIKPIIEDFTQTNWFSEGSHHEGDRTRQDLFENAIKSRLEIKATLGEVDLRIADIMSMRPGDIIDLGRAANSELLLSIGSEPAFFGQPITFRNKNALLLKKAVDPRETVL